MFSKAPTAPLQGAPGATLAVGARPGRAAAPIRRAHTPVQAVARPGKASKASSPAPASEPKARDVSTKAATTTATPKAGTKKGLISKEVAKDLYSDMFLGRLFEDKCAEYYYRGKLFGFVHLYCGQEAVSTGFIRHLNQDDYVCSTYRDHVHALSKGCDPREVMAELFGKKTGLCRGQGGSMHMFSAKHGVLGGYAFIGEGIPVGLGAAFQIAYKKRALGDESATQVSINFFGDGTCNVGQFYECLNMASLYKLPCIFVVENNKWAIGMQHNRATGTTLGDEEPYIYKKGPVFGMPGVLVDGMDVLKVREVAEEAIARARRGDGPTLIECETYRFRGHSLADPDELRSKEEKEHYAARDPIPQLKKYILDNGIFTEEDIKAMEKEVEDIVEDSLVFAEESPKPDRGQLLENVFADPKGFGIAANGQYRYMLPGFTTGDAEVS